MVVNPFQRYIPAGKTQFSCWKFHMKSHIPIRDIAPANTIPIFTQKCRSIGCVHQNIFALSWQCLHRKCKYLSFQRSMVNTGSLERFFCLVIRNVAATADNRSFYIAFMGRGERKPHVLLSLKMGRHSQKNVEFSVVSPIALVQYIPQRTKYNKMQSFTSLPLSVAVESSLFYIPIFIASPDSHDTPLASLLVVGLCFQTLWECVVAVGCICRLTQVGGGVVALCPGKYFCWNLQMLHTLFQLVPVFHSRRCLFVRGLQILFKPSFWFGNRLPSCMGKFRGVWNRHIRTS